MKKILATIAKEWLLMRRDIAGMMLIFTMPALLVIVMSLTEEGPFKDYQDMRFDLLLADNDAGSLAQGITNGLRASKNFHIIDSLDGKPLTEAKLKDLLRNGNYTSGIVIPRGVTAEMVNAANIIANNLSEKMGLGNAFTVRPPRDTMYVRVLFDPDAKPTFKNSITFALDKYITYTCSNMLINRMGKLGNATNPTDTGVRDLKRVFQGIGIREVALNEDKKEQKQFINSVQHNVPAWAIFGMFFIVVPIASHLIRERKEGSTLRITLIPHVQIPVSLGRTIFYTLVCTVQFVLMFCIGIWVMPLLHLPSLYIGTHPEALLPVAICISFAATTYGYLVGALFKTANQAMPFGSFSIVIFSAIGGIWMPVELLSGVMQRVAMISPLHWSLAAVNGIILRNGDLHDVWKYLCMLLIFGIVAWVLSTYISTRYRSVQ
ncbi:MAG: ABC transporter permease [Taibaiella sp.]|nr:ABC transporter permease [Taibaiella sp.]